MNQPFSPVPSIQPITEQPKPKSKRLLVLIIAGTILIFAVSAVAAYYFWYVPMYLQETTNELTNNSILSTPSPLSFAQTANWWIYTDDIGKFQIKLPPEYKFFDSVSQERRTGPYLEGHITEFSGNKVDYQNTVLAFEKNLKNAQPGQSISTLTLPNFIIDNTHADEGAARVINLDGINALLVLLPDLHVVRVHINIFWLDNLHNLLEIYEQIDLPTFNGVSSFVMEAVQSNEYQTLLNILSTFKFIPR